MQRVSRKQLQTTAIHEAGHAVIARVLGLSCGIATIVPNYEEMEWGHAIVHDPLTTLTAWHLRLREQYEQGVCDLKDRSAWRGFILAKMAGAEAENVTLASATAATATIAAPLNMSSTPVSRNSPWRNGSDTSRA